MYSFPELEPVYCSMFSSNCCFLTCIEISQKAGKVVWYSHLFKHFPEFVVIYTVKGFGVVNKAEVDVFLELLLVSMIQQTLAIWFLVPLPFLNPAWTSGSLQFMYCWCLAWRILSITLLLVRCVQLCGSVSIAFLWDWNENWPFSILWPLLSFPNFLAYWVQHFHSIIFQDLK